MIRPSPRPGDILGALDELGLLAGARVSGGEVYVLCPYHDDRSTGSFSIATGTGLNKCFSCGNGGSFARFLAASQRMSLGQARRWCLARQLPAVSGPQPAAPAEPQVSEASLALFTPPPPGAMAARGISAVSCEALGILWDPARDSWILPVRDPHTGILRGWQAKRNGWVRNHPDGVTVSSALFGCHLLGGGPVTLVESPLDAAVMRDAGYPAAASWGAGVSDAQLSLIADRCSRLILALDDDAAGHRATARIWRGWHLLPVLIFAYPGTGTGKDPGELTAAQIRHGMEHLLC